MGRKCNNYEFENWKDRYNSIVRKYSVNFTRHDYDKTNVVH